MSRLRAWCFTLNNYTEIEYNHLAAMKPKYMVIGKEVGESGTPHLQGYIEFENARMMKGVKAEMKCDRVHLEGRKGTAKQAADYCKKDGNFIEQGKISEQGKRNDLKELTDKIVSGEKTVDQIALEEPTTYCKYRNGLRDIEDIANRTKKRTVMTKGIWYWGKSGAGKSHRAFEEAGDDYYPWVKDRGWWNGYTGQKVVVINEFRDGISYDEMLQLVDKWPYSVRRRNREPMPFTSEKVIVTSVLKPEECFKELDQNDSIDQLLRRFEVIELKNESVQK